MSGVLYLSADTSGDLLLRWNGEVLTVPTSRDGVVFEQVGSYLTVRSSLGFTIKWDGRQSVFVKVSFSNLLRSSGMNQNVWVRWAEEGKRESFSSQIRVYSCN